MKKRYQISKRRAINRFAGWAQRRTEPIQFALPTAEILQLAQQGLGELLRHAGRLFIESVLEAEVEHLVGVRSKPNAARSASRWGRPVR